MIDGLPWVGSLFTDDEILHTGEENSENHRVSGCDVEAEKGAVKKTGKFCGFCSVLLQSLGTRVKNHVESML